MLKAAFNFMLNLHWLPATITRPGAVPVTSTIRITPSNYFRNLEVMGKVTSEGKEFVISKEIMDSTAFGIIKKGDRIVNTQLGTMVVSESPKEMFGLGGEILGYRVRVG